YEGNPHEHLVGHPHQIMDTKYIYEHVKQENATWIRGLRNCLLPNQRIITNDGYKNIEDIKVGDKVLDKDGILQLVTGTTKRDLVEEEIVRISRVGAP